ncbi:hypothetical protein CAEBREN_21003 [Caenorhabditis brenneri]|uniref:Uncharacterized protein n=1 Tax=Caenorhabditis brenneri TaxID=135651 RepID=G0MJP4_CAEBE|nr:hypothetical protein CAEBREN_21003 [Caenorhabditis brenneri]
MNLETTTDSLCDQLKKFFAKQMEKERRAEIEEAARQAANGEAAREAAREAGKGSGVFELTIVGLVMNLDNTTESLCDQLKKFVAKQMEKERKAEIEEAARQAANAIAAKEAAKAAAVREAASAELAIVIGVSCLVTVILVALGFLFYYLWLRWKSKRAGPVTRTPKTLISKKNVDEYYKNKISRAKVYSYSYSVDANSCTGKLKEIMRVLFNLTENTPKELADIRASQENGTKTEQNDVPPSYSSRAGPVTRIPKTPISKENLREDSTNEISMANVYYDSSSYIANGCTQKLKKIMRVMGDIFRNHYKSTFPDYLMKAYAKEAVINELAYQRRLEEEERQYTRFDWIGLMLLLLHLAVLLLILYLLGLLIYYIWSYWKSGRRGPMTQNPICPVNDKTLDRYRGSEEHGNMTPEAKILYLPLDNKPNKGSTKVDAILKMIFNLKNFKKNLVPTHTRTVSIKMEGFNHGERCYEFVPMDGVTPGSHYSYQMYGKNKIQVTRYVVGGKSWVAGFCIYIPKNSVWNVHYNMNLVKELMSSEFYPGIALAPAPTAPTAPRNTELQVKYCPKLQREVMTMEEVEGEIVVSHQEWDKYEGRMTTEKCDVCSKKLSIRMPPPAYSAVAVSEF